MFIFQKKQHSVVDIAVEWRRVRTAATRREYNTAETADRTRTTVVAAAAPRVHAAYDISRRGPRDENVRAAVHDHNELVSRPRAAAAVTAYTIRRAPGLNGGAVGTGRPAVGRGVGESSAAAAAGTRWYGPPPPPTLHPPPPFRYANDAIKRRTLELEHDVCCVPRPAGGRKRVKIISRKSVNENGAVRIAGLTGEGRVVSTATEGTSGKIKIYFPFVRDRKVFFFKHKRFDERTEITKKPRFYLANAIVNATAADAVRGVVGRDARSRSDEYGEITSTQLFGQRDTAEGDAPSGGRGHDDRPGDGTPSEVGIVAQIHNITISRR